MANQFVNTAMIVNGAVIVNSNITANGGTINANNIQIGGNGVASPAGFNALDTGRARSTMVKSESMDKIGAWNHWRSLMLVIPPSGTAAPVIDSVKMSSNATNNPLTIDTVSDTVAGELLIVIVFTDNGNGQTWTTPGWTLFKGTNATFGNNAGAAFYRTANSSEPSTYTFTGTNATWYRACMFQVKNANVTVNTSLASANAGNTSVFANAVAASVTTTTANSLVISAYGSDTNKSSFSIPTGWQLIVDPNPAHIINVTDDHKGGTISPYAWETGVVDGKEAFLAVQKIQVAAGVVGDAVAGSGRILMAYAGGGGCIDSVNLILQGAGGSVESNNQTIRIWRDGETTPSINVRWADLVFARDASGSRIHTRYHSFYNGGGRMQFQKFITIPFFSSIVVEDSNPSTTGGITLWTQVGWHTNTLTKSQWNGRSHLTCVTNGNYPSTNSCAAYSEVVLCDIVGSGALNAVHLNAQGHDNNSEAFEEGQLRFYIDGESIASWSTSGTEDAFLSSFNWENETIPVVSDYYGTTIHTAPGVSTPGHMSSYRYFVDKEPVTFSTRLKVTWTVGLVATAGVTANVDVISLCEVYTND